MGGKKVERVDNINPEELHSLYENGKNKHEINNWFLLIQPFYPWFSRYKIFEIKGFAIRCIGKIIILKFA